MPKSGCTLPNDSLHYEEFSRLLNLLCTTGIKKIRFTGGEPLLYPKLSDLISQVKQFPSINKVELTTNGILLADKLEALQSAGLTGVNISLDCIEANLFAKITRGGDINRVFSAIDEAKKLHLPLKLNSVILKNINEDEIIPLALFAQKHKIPLRFIELMPLGEARLYAGIGEAKIKQQLERFFGKIVPLAENNSPAHYYRVADCTIGFISALSHKFCASCNRLRLTSSGLLKPCLFSKAGVDLKALLRADKSDEEILQAIKGAIYHKPKQHHFEDINSADREDKFMSLIGG